MTMAKITRLRRNELPPNAIAVIGMAGRFPGADSVTAFWDNLRRGEESIATLSEEALTAAGVSANDAGQSGVCSARAPARRDRGVRRGILRDDPVDARMMDPQQRLFLQTAWHAFEDAGYDPATFDGVDRRVRSQRSASGT